MLFRSAGSGRSRACCTFCGVLRRRALEEGAHLVGATHVVTGERRRDPEGAWWEGRMRRIGHRKGAAVRAQVVMETMNSLKESTEHGEGDMRMLQHGV